jgi:hypothetical protein
MTVCFIHSVMMASSVIVKNGLPVSRSFNVTYNDTRLHSFSIPRNHEALYRYSLIIT